MTVHKKRRKINGRSRLPYLSAICISVSVKNENEKINIKEEDEEVENNNLNFQSYINSTHTREIFHVMFHDVAVIEIKIQD